MLANTTTGHDRVHAICGKLRRDETVSAAKARAYARLCESMARANNRKPTERLIRFDREIADNNVVDPDLAGADLLESLDVEST